MSAEPSNHPLSWRDPDGFVARVDGRILRAVSIDKADQMRRLLAAPWLTRLVQEGSIPHTVELANPPKFMEGMDRFIWLEHVALAFPCYPHEITAMQLYDSAQLTLKIAIEAAQDGWILKDASAWNVLFSDGRPVFVDLLSFEPCLPGEAWAPYGQFIRHFLLPLMLHRRLCITPDEIFSVNRDGITPERASQLLRGMSLASSAAFEYILLPKWLKNSGGRKIEAESAGKKSTFGAALSRDLLLSTLRRLLRKLTKLQPDLRVTDSVWKRYEEDRLHYSQQDLVAKERFVREHVQSGGTVLDLGCNAGEYSLLAAERAEAVVSADFDHPALSRLYMRVRGQGRKITPVVLNVGRPTPAVGWLNREIPSFIERGAGKFDCILMLGLIHHLLVSERASLMMLAELINRLGPQRVIVEWVDPKDPKFRQLAGLNAPLYNHLEAAALERCMDRNFQLIAKLRLPSGTRVMYLWSSR